MGRKVNKSMSKLAPKKVSELKVSLSVDNVMEIINCCIDCNLTQSETEDYVKAFFFDVLAEEKKEEDTKRYDAWMPH